jgi:hypothetical protein
MPALYLFKVRTGESLGERQLKADLQTAMACGPAAGGPAHRLRLQLSFGLLAG